MVRGWHQVSKYKSSGEKIGNGCQGVVFGVINHPDKVVKKYHTFNEYSHKFITTNQFKYDRIASDKGFGPKIYEISSSGRVVDLSDKSTMPKFQRKRFFSVVMEKLADIEIEKHYVGIVNTWKKMRQNGLSSDSFYGYSAQKKAIVCTDYGAVGETKDGVEFRSAVRDLLEIEGIELKIAQKYTDNLPEEPFTKDILVPVLTDLGHLK